jgi:hypothetical protein
MAGLCVTTAGCGSQSVSSSSAGEELSGEVETDSATSADSEHATVSTVTLTEGKYSDEKLDDSWSEKTADAILLEGDSISADSDSVSIDGTTVTITKAGTYVLSGELEDGQIIVDTESDDSVKLVLNGATISSSSSAAIFAKQGKTIITLAEGTQNTVSDSDREDEDTNAAIYAKDDLTFNGSGSLTVNGNYNHGIQSKDDLKFINGSYQITSVGDSIVGKDSVSIKDGTFDITSEADGIKSTNIKDSEKGYIMIDGGDFHIEAAQDAIQAETLLRVNDGTFDIVTGGGSDNAQQKADTMGWKTADDTDSEAVSSKGLKSYVELILAGGTFSMDTCDDAFHSNQDVTVENGTFTILSGDDGIHADSTLTINGGSIDVQQSYEGLEGFEIVINDGDINVVASDDGINAAGDSDSVWNPESAMDFSGGDTSDMQQPNGDSSDMELPDGEQPDMAQFDGDTSQMEMPDGEMPDMEQPDGDASDMQQPNGEMPSMGQSDGDDSDTKQPGGEMQDMSQSDGEHSDSDHESETHDTSSDDDDDNNDKKGKFQFGNQGGMSGGMMGGMMNEDEGALLTINGGTITVSAQGDGLDANGDIVINDGTVVVQGPTNGGNGTLDYGGSCEINGGTFFGVGAMGMQQNPGSDSTQYSIVQNLSKSAQAGTTITLKDSSGSTITEMTAEKEFQWYAVSAPDLEEGETYTICVGDQTYTVTLDSIVTQAN